MNAQTPIEPFVRPAIADDAEGIAKVHVKSWQEAYVGLLPQATLDRQSVPNRMRWWSGQLQETRNDRWTFVAIDPVVRRRRLRRRHPPPARDVRPHLQDPGSLCPAIASAAGLGRKLMHALGNAMAQYGPGDVALWSLASNMPARAFYEAVGGRLFAVLTERDHGRAPLAGYRWRSGAELAEKSAPT